MVKGRSSNPSTERVGNWYQHTNCKEYVNVGSRQAVTSTGAMLNMNKESRQHLPPTPPQPFLCRSQTLYDSTNPFSYHDNRNNIQLKGEYLGNGRDTRLLGKRHLNQEINQHKSEISDFLKHHSRDMTESFFHTNYTLSHDEKKSEPIQHRRFAKTYNEASSGLTAPQTTTTDQFRVQSGSLPHKTSNQTLVSSIEPYLKHNSWKYTYHSHGKHDIYPKVWGDRCSVHLPRQKPRFRPIVVNRVERDCRTCA